MLQFWPWICINHCDPYNSQYTQNPTGGTLNYMFLFEFNLERVLRCAFFFRYFFFLYTCFLLFIVHKIPLIVVPIQFFWTAAHSERNRYQQILSIDPNADSLRIRIKWLYSYVYVFVLKEWSTWFCFPFHKTWLSDNIDVEI